MSDVMEAPKAESESPEVTLRRPTVSAGVPGQDTRFCVTGHARARGSIHLAPVLCARGLTGVGCCAGPDAGRGRGRLRIVIKERPAANGAGEARRHTHTQHTLHH